jgi:hypothetical protein
MTKERSLFRRTGLVTTLVVLMLAAAILSVQGSAPPAGAPGAPRADIIRIDGLKQFGALERPAVIFLHERHTQALSKKNQDCAACHLPDQKYMSAKFKRLTDASKTAVMSIYHDNCTACHRRTADAGEPSGPVVCAGCHQERPVASSWAPIGMDTSLHYRHLKAQDNKCEVCHHQYDSAAKQLVYVKGKEDDCRFCHRDRPVDNVRSMRTVSHAQCIDCHQKRIAQNQDAGPATCGGCHDAAVQRKIAKVKDVPRLMRGQPDATLVKVFKTASGPAADPLARPAVVPFNHKGHEGYTDACRACHHESFDACGKCHTLQGAKEGRFVTLQTAIHRASAQASCVGCHVGVQDRKECAGCHTAISRKEGADLAGCASCHRPLPAGSPADPKALATALLDAHRPVTGTYPAEDIPEIVEIKSLSKQYEAARMPHRKIVQALVKPLADSRLAGAFHRDPGTICQGCHHNSPATRKPPACASCHGRPFDGRNLTRPGLQAAYHLQCMDCHRVMGVEKPAATDCTGCHKDKS